MAMIFDSHAHYDDAQYDSDRDAVLNSLPERGICGVIHGSVDKPSALFGVEQAHRLPYFYTTVGFHPETLKDASDDDLELFRGLLKDPKAVAVGEIGLDYHYEEFPREVQLEWFEKQLQLAVSESVPVVIHDREAHEDTFRLLRKYRPAGVIHCFSGSAELAAEAVKLGLYIGLGGAVTFKNARKPVEVAASVPLDRLLLETDAPYMAPVPLRGTRNESPNIQYVAEKIAELRGISADAVIEAATDNTCRLFGIHL